MKSEPRNASGSRFGLEELEEAQTSDFRAMSFVCISLLSFVFICCEKFYVEKLFVEKSKMKIS